MVNEVNVLAKFFEQEIFDLDNDEIEDFLCDFTEGEINDNLIKRLEFAASSKDEIEEISWKLGRIFGEYKRIPVDGVLISNFPNYSLGMRIACLNFLSGYWDEAAPDLVCLRSFLRLVSKSIIGNNWSHKLSELSVEAVAVVYGNNKSVFMQDDELLKPLDVVRSYAKTSIADSPGKSLLTRI